MVLNLILVLPSVYHLANNLRYIIYLHLNANLSQTKQKVHQV